MQKEEIKKYMSKQIKIFLKNGFVYNGEIVEVHEDCLELYDRYRNKIMLDLSSIMSIGENSRSFENNYE